MKIFIDESGGFLNGEEVTDTFVSALIVPDCFYNDLIEDYKNFLNNSFGTLEEVKGSQFDIVHRLDFTELLLNYKDKIKISISFLPSSENSLSNLRKHRNKTADMIDELKTKYSEPARIEYFTKYSKKVRYDSRFSNQDFFQFILYENCLRNAIQYSIVYFTNKDFESCFEKYEYLIDRKLKTKLASCEKFLIENLHDIWDYSSHKNKLPPLNLPVEWKEKGHLFIDKYMIDDYGISVDELILNKIKFVDSKNEPGVQIVDNIINTYFTHWKDPSDKSLRVCASNILNVCGSTNGKQISAIKVCG